jgi:hypothetical protein
MEAIEISQFPDCEIRTLAFDYPSLVLKLFDPTEMTYHTLAFRDVVFCVFESDHLQNVVSALQVFDSLTEALRDHAFSNYLQMRNIDENLRKNIGNNRICYIRPITGGDLIIIFREVEELFF